MVTQAIVLLDTLDKDINTFAMRVRYVYSLPYLDPCVVRFNMPFHNHFGIYIKFHFLCSVVFKSHEYMFIHLRRERDTCL